MSSLDDYLDRRSATFGSPADLDLTKSAEEVEDFVEEELELDEAPAEVCLEVPKTKQRRVKRAAAGVDEEELLGLVQAHAFCANLWERTALSQGVLA